MATDIETHFVLVAFNNPGAVRVYRINADDTPGDEVRQSNSTIPAFSPIRYAQRRTIGR